ncbi:MAG TPA: Uma2 family endonuclease [Pyrinomonadaceae bacterium]|nr:Uma2 family endonuclease [Pyrinomonadaceae bacterium]
MTQDIQTHTPTPHASPTSSDKISYEDFLRSEEYVWAEWVDGEVIQLSPASKRHQLLVNFLAALLQHFVEANRLGLVISAPFQMKTGAGLPGREPDILFIATENLERLRDTYLAGAADMVVEVISPESSARDRGDKFLEYEKGGVKEYWLIDPIRQLAEFYRLDNAVYRLVPVDNGGIYRSVVIAGVWLRADWLWQEPLPPLMSILKEWGLV